MALCAKDIMQEKVLTVTPDMSLVELERVLIQSKIGGAPVMEKGALVGIVSRSDIVRQLVVEQSLAEVVSDYYRDFGSRYDDHLKSKGTDTHWISERIGQRMEELVVRDFMVRHLLMASPNDSIQKVAQIMAEHHIHRVLVTEGDRLCGVVSTLDIANIFAEGRATV